MPTHDGYQCRVFNKTTCGHFSFTTKIFFLNVIHKFFFTCDEDNAGKKIFFGSLYIHCAKEVQKTTIVIEHTALITSIRSNCTDYLLTFPQI